MRTLVYFIIYSSIFLSSCTNHGNGKKESEPDSKSFYGDDLSQIPDPDYVIRLNTGMDNDQLMRQLKGRPGSSGKMRALDSLYNRVYRFTFYISEVREFFRAFCGDSTGSHMVKNNQGKAELTNQFFFDNKNGIRFFEKLGEMKQELFSHSKNDSLTAEIKKLGEPGLETFRNITPLAAVANLYSFDTRVVKLHNLILKEYMKN